MNLEDRRHKKRKACGSTQVGPIGDNVAAIPLEAKGTRRRQLKKLKASVQGSLPPIVLADPIRRSGRDVKPTEKVQAMLAESRKMGGRRK